MYISYNLILVTLQWIYHKDDSKSVHEKYLFRFNFCGQSTVCMDHNLLFPDDHFSCLHFFPVTNNGEVNINNYKGMSTYYILIDTI